MLTHRITIRKKGQMTLPAEIREELDLDEGDVVYVQKEGNRYVIVTDDNITDPTAGALAKYAKGLAPITQDDMDKAVESGIIESWQRFEHELEEEDKQ